MHISHTERLVELVKLYDGLAGVLINLHRFGGDNSLELTLGIGGKSVKIPQRFGRDFSADVKPAFEKVLEKVKSEIKAMNVEC